MPSKVTVESDRPASWTTVGRAGPPRPAGGGAEMDGRLGEWVARMQADGPIHFLDYKSSFLKRRIAYRMCLLGLPRIRDYLAYVEEHPEESESLCRAVLISITSFFRDPVSWRYLARRILPRILRAKPAGEPVRVWSVGCASGEEVYSLAMLLCEAMGEDRFVRRSTLFGTDVDEAALARARRGVYTATELRGVPRRLVERFFRIENGQARFRRSLFQPILFHRHDAVRDPPFSHLDLVVCRNTLMYFEPAFQKRILARLHFGLNPGGFLFLGRSERPLDMQTIFSPVNRHLGFFMKPCGPVPANDPPELLGFRCDPPAWPAALKTAATPEISVRSRGARLAAGRPGRCRSGSGPPRSSQRRGGCSPG